MLRKIGYLLNNNEKNDNNSSSRLLHYKTKLNGKHGEHVWHAFSNGQQAETNEGCLKSLQALLNSFSERFALWAGKYLYHHTRLSDVHMLDAEGAGKHHMPT